MTNYPKDDKRLAVVQHHGNEENEANAHLIAAAPDLLEALEMAKGVIELGLAEAKMQNAYSGEKIDTYGIKRAVFLAIAKAKGE